MKKLLHLLLLPILLFQFSNCKPEGKGTLVLTLESSSAMPPEIQLKTIAIIQQRLEALKIDDEDIFITPKENVLELKITGMSNYPADIAPRIRKAVTANGTVEMWETHKMGDIVPLFSKALGQHPDSVNTSRVMERFYRITPPGNFQYDGDNCAFGYVKMADRMEVDRIMDTIIASKLLPANFRYVWSVPQVIENQKVCRLVFLKESRNGEATIKNPEFKKVELVENDTRLELSCQLAPFDANAWAKMTKANISRPVAIVVNGVAFTWPVVQSEITGGAFFIMGPFDRSEYEDLKSILSTPAFPVELKIVAENTIP
jgi:hypothetical protein